MKNIVLYHSADYDGLFSREVAKKFLPQNTEFIGWNYGDPTPKISEGAQLYMIDISIDDLMAFPNLIWIDHHKSAIAKFPQDIKGYRIDGVAACRLAYQWFLKQQRDLAGIEYPLPNKQQYDDRQVPEPFALTLAGEYDIWNHKGDGDVEFQYGLDCEVDRQDYSILLSAEGNKFVPEIIQNGAIALRCYTKRDGIILNDNSYIQEFEGLKFLALNTPSKGSGLFAAKDKPETGHDALMKYNWNGKEWEFSLYHSADKKYLDLSEIAAKFGGGGHKGACGFRTKELPFSKKSP